MSAVKLSWHLFPHTRKNRFFIRKSTYLSTYFTIFSISYLVRAEVPHNSCIGTVGPFQEIQFQFPASYERKSLSTVGKGFETMALITTQSSHVRLSLVQCGYVVIPSEFPQISRARPSKLY